MYSTRSSLSSPCRAASGLPVPGPVADARGQVLQVLSGCGWVCKDGEAPQVIRTGDTVWIAPGERHWHGELTQSTTPVHHADPYTAQLRHFAAAIQGTEAPLCTALDGLRTLAETGVDRISIGTLTKDVKATDFSMRFEEL